MNETSSPRNAGLQVTCGVSHPRREPHRSMSASSATPANTSIRPRAALRLGASTMEESNPVNGERPGELDRLVGTSSALEALVGIFEDDIKSVDDALSRVARISVDAIVDADAVSVTVLSDPDPRTAAY